MKIFAVERDDGMYMTFLKHFSFVAVSFVVFCVVTSNVMAFDDKELVFGIDDSRMRIISGIFTVAGTTIETISGKETKNIIEDCYVAFDYSNGFYRFDRNGQGKYLVTPDAVFHRWKNKPGSNVADITQHPRDYGPHTNINPFEIRSLGFFSCNAPYYDFKYDKYRLFLTKNAKVLDVKDGVLAYLALQNANPKDRSGAEYPIYKFWVDKTHGYTTTQIQVDSFVNSELTWKQIDGVYVPVAFRQKYHSLPADQIVEANWVLNWQAVNKTIPSEIFSYKDLIDKNDVEGVLYAGNADRTGTPVVLEHISSGDSTVIQKSMTPTNLSKIVMALGLLLIAISLGKKIYDWRSRKSE